MFFYNISNNVNINKLLLRQYNMQYYKRTRNELFFFCDYVCV